MAYAVKKDGTGWRAVESEADLDAENETYSLEQPPSVEVGPSTILSSLEFLGRFTPTERKDVMAAKKTIIELEIFYDDLLAAGYVDLTDQRTIDGVTALKDAGLITASRKTAILNPD